MISTSTYKGMNKYLHIVHDLRARGLMPSDCRRLGFTTIKPKPVAKTAQTNRKATVAKPKLDMQEKFQAHQRQQLVDSIRPNDRLSDIKSVGNGL